MSLAYAPKDGLAWNPLRSWPRNEKCFCGSGKKFKKCCEGRVSVTVDASKVKDLARVIKARLQAGEALRILKEAQPLNEREAKEKQEAASC